MENPEHSSSHQIFLLSRNDRLDVAYETIDELHNAISEGNLEELKGFENREELLNWLRDIIYTAQETIEELDTSHQQTLKPKLVLVSKLVEESEVQNLMTESNEFDIQLDFESIYGDVKSEFAQQQYRRTILIGVISLIVVSVSAIQVVAFPSIDNLLILCAIIFFFVSLSIRNRVYAGID